MSNYELYSDESSSSVEPERESRGDIDDYELEVEEFDVGSASASNEASGKHGKTILWPRPLQFFPIAMNPLLILRRVWLHLLSLSSFNNISIV
jgi:hypothetical protein